MQIVKIRDQSCKADPVLTAAKMVPVAFIKGPASMLAFMPHPCNRACMRHHACSIIMHVTCTRTQRMWHVCCEMHATRMHAMYAMHAVHIWHMAYA